VIFAVLKYATFVVLAFGLFCMSLVVALIGVVDPKSSPRAELSKLFGYVGAIEQWWRRPRL
jgi:hypothetical protein